MPEIKNNELDTQEVLIRMNEDILTRFNKVNEDLLTLLKEVLDSLP